MTRNGMLQVMANACELLIEGRAEEAHTRLNAAIRSVSEGEPVFELRSQDMVAPATARVWIEFAQLVGASEAKTDAAMSDAMAMDKWQKDNPDMVKVPD